MRKLFMQSLLTAITIGATAATLPLASTAHAASVKQPTQTTVTSIVTPPSSYAFGNSGIDGGSFVSVVAADPFNAGVLVAGSDVGGVYRSTDGGKTWSAANVGISLGHLSVAGVLFSATVPNRVYAALGYYGSGGIQVSNDDGKTWSVLSSTPGFNGGNGRPGRTSGDVIAVSPNGTLYAATYTQGLLASTDNGSTWQTLGLQNVDLRSVAVDTANNRVLVGTYGSGLYQAPLDTTATPVTSVAGAPIDVEDIAVAGTTTWLAAGQYGVYRSDDGVTWNRTATSVAAQGPSWKSVATSADGSVIYAGSIYPQSSNGTFISLVHSSDGGTTWSAAPGTLSAVSYSIGGPGGQTWWMSNKQAGMLLGGASFWANHIAISPQNSSTVFVSGRSDVWGTTDGATSWYPMVRGLGTTVSRQVVVDPASPYGVRASVNDWTTISSTNDLATVTNDAPSAPGADASYAVTLDTSTQPATAYLGVGDNSTNTGGDVYKRDPVTHAWSSTGLGSLVGGKQPVGLTYTKASNHRIMLAAVQGGGVWRKLDGGAWTQVSATAMTSAAATWHASFAWIGSTAYLYDPQSGVWRSSNLGSSWTLIWAQPSTTDGTGFVATTSAASNSLFVSVGFNGLYRIDNPGTGTYGAGIVPVKLTSFGAVGSYAGPISSSASGYLFFATVLTPTLWRSTDGGLTWTEIDDAAYRAQADFATSIAASPNGKLFVSTKGEGVLVGNPI